MNCEIKTNTAFHSLKSISVFLGSMKSIIVVFTWNGHLYKLKIISTLTGLLSWAPRVG